MTYAALIVLFLAAVEAIKKLNPAYKQPGDGTGGVCDCIGLIIGAVRRIGLKWKGIHGSNYGARYETTDLAYIAKESDLELGDAVYKACDKKNVVKLACNKGTKTHKWDLPQRYWEGNPYYNGDLLDYYHAGVVTQVNPLRITHMTSPHMKVDTNLNGGWNYHGKVKPIVEAAQKGTVPEQKPVQAPAQTAPSVPVPNAGSKAIVVSSNGLPVKMREYPSTSCRTWFSLPVGTEVTIVEPGEKWAKIDARGKKGWYMMAEFLDVVGDGKGKY